MKFLILSIVALVFVLVPFLWSACVVASRISREEEMIESEKKK